MFVPFLCGFSIYSHPKDMDVSIRKVISLPLTGELTDRTETDLIPKIKT